MIHVIPIIVKYVGGDLSTPFARDNLRKMEGKLIRNPDGPICLLLERKESYGGYLHASSLFRHGYFTTELLRRMTPLLSGTLWSNVFESPYVPPEFIEESKEGRKEFWNYSRIPLTEIKREAETTKSTTICEYILCNPALFSEGVEKAEEVVNVISSRYVVRGQVMAMSLSSNVRAPVQFFIRNPRYVSWNILVDNTGEVFRGDEGEVLSFLNGEFGSGLKGVKWALVQNPAIPLKFFEGIIDRFDRDTLKRLSRNPSVTLSWWKENVKDPWERKQLFDFASKPSTPYSFILEDLPGCTPIQQLNVITNCYNAPAERIIEICEKNPDDVNWETVALNRGFWIHLAEESLLPILQQFFGVSPLPMGK